MIESACLEEESLFVSTKTKRSQKNHKKTTKMIGNVFKRKFVTKTQTMAPPPEIQMALGPWKPKEAKGRLPDVTHIRPKDIQLQPHPRWRKEPQTLLRAIDLESRFRYGIT
jgi:hypothetical protein